jgi:hypothetical protein
MNKHRYQAKGLHQVDWGKLAEAAGDRRVVFAVDVAKEAFYGALLVSAQALPATLRWRHPSGDAGLGGAPARAGAGAYRGGDGAQRDLRRQPA